MNRDRKGACPSTYLITFACYGSWLPGQTGAVDRHNNVFGTPLAEANPAVEIRSISRMLQGPYLLNACRRSHVLSSIQQVCSYRNWTLLAAHVRTNHGHVVVAADQNPEQVMNTLKAYATRALNSNTLDGPDRKRWARHGRTRYLSTGQQLISAAMQYVLHEQREPMAVFPLPGDC